MRSQVLVEEPVRALSLAAFVEQQSGSSVAKSVDDLLKPVKLPVQYWIQDDSIRPQILVEPRAGHAIDAAHARDSDVQVAVGLDQLNQHRISDDDAVDLRALKLPHILDQERLSTDPQVSRTKTRPIKQNLDLYPRVVAQLDVLLEHI
jgi:hypothetical protein